MTFGMRTANLRAINSMTKYPSIPTYHTLDPANGNLAEPAIEFSGGIVATEKIDGTNARIILFPDGDYLLGSREHLLYARGDLIGNPAEGIVEHLRPVAEQIAADVVQEPPLVPVVRVLYLEVYGGNIGRAARQYTNYYDEFGWRLFDNALFNEHQVLQMQEWSSERIASWRDNGGQTFGDEAHLNWVSDAAGLLLTPRLFCRPGADLPSDVEGMYNLLMCELPKTRAALLGDGLGRAEGIVFRTLDRKAIAKARFQDYERTFRRQQDKSRSSR